MRFIHFLKQFSPQCQLIRLIDQQKQSKLSDFDFCLNSFEWMQLNQGSCMEHFIEKTKVIVYHLIKQRQNVLLHGYTGMKKTSTALSVMGNLPNDFLVHSVPLLPQTTGSHLQSYLNRILVQDPSIKTRYVPANDSQLLVFIDDLQISESKKSSNRPFWEFLRTFMDKSGYWSNSSSYRDIGNFSILSTIETTERGESPLKKRFMRHFVNLFLNSSNEYEQDLFSSFQTKMGKKLSSQLIGNTDTTLKALLNATRELYTTLKDQMKLDLNFPLNVFSFHDIDKLVYGVLNFDFGVNIKSDILLSYWSHECQRVFRDRLSQRDLIFYDDYFGQIFQKYFPKFEYESIYFAHQVTFDDQKNLVKSIISNVNHSVLDEQVTQEIRFYPTGSIHYNRLHRILLRNAFGHALLIGLPCVDFMNSVVDLVSKKLHFTLRLFTFSNTSQQTQWISFFKKQILDCVLYNSRTVLCVQVNEKDEIPSLLWAHLHSLYGGTKIKDLWTKNEFDEIINKLIIDMSKDCNQTTQVISVQEASKTFKKRLEYNLRIVICMDKRNHKAMNSLFQYSKLLCSLNIDIYEDYGQMQLESLASNLIHHQLKSQLNDECIQKLSRNCALLFYSASEKSSRYGLQDTLMNLSFYNQFISRFCQLYMERNDYLNEKSNLYESCLSKIHVQRCNFEEDFSIMLLEIEKLPKYIDQIKSQIQSFKDQYTANELKIAQLEKTLKEKEITLKQAIYDKEEAGFKATLLQSKEQFDASISFLHTIRKDDIDELKSFTIIPPIVIQLAEAICILFDKQPSWQEAKKLFISTSFMQKVLAMDESVLTAAKIEKLRKYTEQPMFNPDKLFNINVSVRGFCLWIRHLTHYYYLKSQMSTDAQIAQRIHKLAQTRLSKTEEKVMLDHVLKDNAQIDSKLFKLNTQLKQNVG